MGTRSWFGSGRHFRVHQPVSDGWAVVAPHSGKVFTCAMAQALLWDLARALLEHFKLRGEHSGSQAAALAASCMTPGEAMRMASALGWSWTELPPREEPKRNGCVATHDALTLWTLLERRGLVEKADKGEGIGPDVFRCTPLGIAALRCWLQASTLDCRLDSPPFRPVRRFLAEIPQLKPEDLDWYTMDCDGRKRHAADVGPVGFTLERLPAIRRWKWLVMVSPADHGEERTQLKVEGSALSMSAAKEAACGAYPVVTRMGLEWMLNQRKEVRDE